MIFSVVDTDDKWFTDSTNIQSGGLNIINTAVSRAKKQLVIQNPQSKKIYRKLIFIPKRMERQLCNYYGYIYHNLPYSLDNTILISGLPCCQEDP